MDALWTIFVVMLVAGTVGGLMNFFIAGDNDEKTLAWWQHLIVGIGASFMVPLFLNMISSNLLTDIRGNGKDVPGDLLKLFVLAGFCLVAAVSSRAFIRTISDRLLREVKEAREVAQDAHNEAAFASAAVAPFVEDEATEAPPVVASAPVAVAPPPASSFSSHDDSDPALRAGGESSAPPPQDEHRLINAFSSSSFSLRSLTGLAKDTGLAKATVNSLLSGLIRRGVVVQAQNKSGQPRWYLSSLGRGEAAKLGPLAPPVPPPMSGDFER